jgi:hypothetical protein
MLKLPSGVRVSGVQESSGVTGAPMGGHWECAAVSLTAVFGQMNGSRRAAQPERDFCGRHLIPCSIALAATSAIEVSAKRTHDPSGSTRLSWASSRCPRTRSQRRRPQPSDVSRLSAPSVATLHRLALRPSLFRSRPPRRGGATVCRHRGSERGGSWDYLGCCRASAVYVRESRLIRQIEDRLLRFQSISARRYRPISGALAQPDADANAFARSA